MIIRGPNSDEWCTPDWLFRALDAEFGFDLDPAATTKNAKCARFFTEAEDGLKQSWAGSRAFVNPPYSQCRAWVEKALGESASVVMLLPSRTDTDWFHLLLRHRVEIRWFRKRIAFLLDGVPAESPRFGSLLAIWR